MKNRLNFHVHATRTAHEEHVAQSALSLLDELLPMSVIGDFLLALLERKLAQSLLRRHGKSNRKQRQTGCGRWGEKLLEHKRRETQLAAQGRPSDRKVFAWLVSTGKVGTHRPTRGCTGEGRAM
jgi:hypothetical protein